MASSLTTYINILDAESQLLNDQQQGGQRSDPFFGNSRLTDERLHTLQQFLVLLPDVDRLLEGSPSGASLIRSVLQHLYHLLLLGIQIILFVDGQGNPDCVRAVLDIVVDQLADVTFVIEVRL